MEQTLVTDYLKQFEEWAIALRGRYANDLFFKTTANISALSLGFVAVCILALALSLWVQAIAWYVFVGILIAALGCLLLLARTMLLPLRDTLHYQKLFISNVAHELRTPLSTIKTSTEVALFDDDLEPQARKVHTDVLAELDRISEIINNLLSLNTLTRPERIEFQNVDLGPLLDSAIARLSSLARERGIEVIVRKDNYRVVWGNPTALEQVMMNLIKNAIDYTPKGSHGVIVASIKPDFQGSIVFSVVDSGIGISQEDLFHIFEPFYRADMSRVRNIKKTGSGLGLTIVNEIVRVHHGKIRIHSVPRKGTTASVSLLSGVEPSIVAPPADEKQGGSEVSIDFSKRGAVGRQTS